MKRFGFLKFAGIGMAIVAAIVGFGLFVNRGAHVRLTGTVLKARTVATDTNSAVVLLDFRFQNPASVPFVVKDVAVHVVDASGTAIEGDRVAQTDLDRLLDYYKFVGPRYTPMLLPRERIKPGESRDRTAAGSFGLAEKQLEQRQRFVIRITDVDGQVTEIAEIRK